MKNEVLLELVKRWELDAKAPTCEDGRQKRPYEMPPNMVLGKAKENVLMPLKCLLKY